MGLTASEQATLNFYQWEYRHRGYYHFDTPVDIEVPYIPFGYETYPFVLIGDDGRVPSLFKSIINLLAPPKQEEPIPEEIEVNPRFLTFGKLLILAIKLFTSSVFGAKPWSSST